MTAFAGTFPKVSTATPGALIQRDRDVSVDGHGTVIMGNINEWTDSAEIEALLLEYGWTRQKIETTPGSVDEEHLRRHSAAVGRPSMIRELYFAARAAGLVGGAVVVGEPAPPVIADDPEHTHSPGFTGWKREVIYALETCNTEFQKGIDAALGESRIAQAQRDEFISKRLALVLALGNMATALPDDIRPGEPVANPEGKGQLECDAIWGYANVLREQMARKDLGFFRSVANGHLVDALRAMSNVALALGLRGKKLSYLLFGQPYSTRDSEYVTGFYSWEAQDPIAKKIGDELGAASGSGLAIGGRTS